MCGGTVTGFSAYLCSQLVPYPMQSTCMRQLYFTKRIYKVSIIKSA